VDGIGAGQDAYAKIRHVVRTRLWERAGFGYESLDSYLVMSSIAEKLMAAEVGKAELVPALRVGGLSQARGGLTGTASPACRATTTTPGA
jgi:hypothetical protein